MPYVYSGLVSTFHHFRIWTTVSFCFWYHCRKVFIILHFILCFQNTNKLPLTPMGEINPGIDSSSFFPSKKNYISFWWNSPSSWISCKCGSKYLSGISALIPFVLRVTAEASILNEYQVLWNMSSRKRVLSTSSFKYMLLWLVKLLLHLNLLLVFPESVHFWAK